MNTQIKSELGNLTDPNRPVSYCDLSSETANTTYKMLHDMLLIRAAEQKIAELVADGVAKCPCHLAIGQEAIAVGVASALRKSDRSFGTHRSHSHYLALGGDVYTLFAEILGKSTGCSGGLGGSMHLIDQENGFSGCVPIVAATVPLAVGAGLAAKKDQTGDMAICFFGDGACEEGGVQESLNLASVLQVPTLFVCENNLFSSHLDIHLRQPSDRTARYADAHRVAAHVVDGNDVIAVAQLTQQIASAMRQDNKPAYLEAITYRWLGHVGHRDDIDVGVRRSQDELQAWKKHDPIIRLREAMIEANHITTSDYENLVAEINTNIEKQLQKALAAPYPSTDELCHNLYSE